MKTLICLLAVACSASCACARPMVNKSAEAKGFLLEKREVPNLRMSYIKPSRWVAVNAKKEKCGYVSSIAQRLWRSEDETEILVEAGIFGSREDALRAAEYRVKELTTRKNLKEKMLKGGQLPGQSKGDRVWGLWDPPETDEKANRCLRIGPVSTFAAVIFVKKDVCVQVTSENRRKSVEISELEQLAKKIATKIKPRPEAAGEKK